jgi:hypothetical protein
MRSYIIIVLLLFAGNLFAQQSGPCPCCAGEYRQFDFWIGDWNTYQQDNLAGTNNIYLREDSCVLVENWISAGTAGFTGTSYNFYSRQTGKWHQTWVDNQGGSLLLSGGLEDGKMVLYSEPLPNLQGVMTVNRVIWTPNPDGTVRQLWESSTDEGESWAVLFDGLYKKKGSQ